MLRFVLLGLGTLTTLFYLLLMLKGRKYDDLIEGLPKEGFSDKELLAAGYALQETRLFSMSGKLGNTLLTQASILHPENGGRYADYWARLYWARTLSMCLMFVAITLCAATWIEGIFMFLVLAVAVVGVYLFYDAGANEMKNQLKKRSEACVMEFSNVVSKLALLMNCGLIMKDAWFIVADSKEGEIYNLMKEACAEMKSGHSAAEAVYNFGVRSDAPEIRKFSSTLIQNIEKGGADVTMYMRQQAGELWAHRRQLMLQKGDEAAGKLLIPTMLVLIGLIVIILTMALGGMTSGL